MMDDGGLTVLLLGGGELTMGVETVTTVTTCDEIYPIPEKDIHKYMRMHDTKNFSHHIFELEMQTA